MRENERGNRWKERELYVTNSLPIHGSLGICLRRSDKKGDKERKR
jgi:hypothetical protein